MSPATRPTARPGTLPVLVCLVLTVLTGCSSDAGEASPAPAPASGSPASSGTPEDGEKSVAPTQVTIPSIKVDGAVMRLGLNEDRTVEVPPAEKGMTVGWYTGSAVPGEPGAAVLIGHNDTRFGKAVFHDLQDIDKGADVAVRVGEGKTVHYTVTGTETVDKNSFPTQKVYGETDDRVLRLITCDGAFDAQGHTVDNLIVYAALRDQ